MFFGLDILKRTEGEKFKAFFCTESIMVFETKANTEIELEDIKEMIACATQLLENKKNKNLIIAGKDSQITSEAQKFMQSDEANINHPMAEAIVINSLAQRIIGNFYLSIISAKRPSKLFTSTEKAIEWLKSLN
jgi:hypothetical protein